MGADARRRAGAPPCSEARATRREEAVSTDDEPTTVRERADGIWRRLLDGWRTGTVDFSAALDALSQRELRLLVLDVSHRLLQAAGVLPGGKPANSDRPLGQALAG